MQSLCVILRTVYASLVHLALLVHMNIRCVNLNEKLS